MQELDEKFAELYEDAAKSMGMGGHSLVMNIFARLYMKPEPIAMDELAKETGYSLASISNTIKMLGPVMKLKRIKKPGSKKLYLYIEKDIFSIMQSQMAMKAAGMKLILERLDPVLKEYKEKAKSKEDKAKLKILEEYSKQMDRAEQIFFETAKRFEAIR